MFKTTDILQDYTDAPIERILGQRAEVVNRTVVSVSRDIYTEWIEVAFEEDHWPEEHARLNLFPVDDGQFCVQLLYLQFTEQPGNALICRIVFMPPFFDQYPLSILAAGQPFKADKVTEEQFAICAQTNLLLQQLHSVTMPSDFIETLEHTELTIHLLRRSLECIIVPFTVCPVPACRFLAYDSEREKIALAKTLVEENLDNPYSIKELSRKVAMNECYLKKGFKAITGKAIHEYTQELRIIKAKDMLQQEGFSVSDVANSLGYSSISHFSTAFKKATGMKPCELLA